MKTHITVWIRPIVIPDLRSAQRRCRCLTAEKCLVHGKKELESSRGSRGTSISHAAIMAMCV